MIMLFFTALLLALVELDGTEAGQFMLSRPLVIGPTLGFALGDPGLGAGIGALVETLSLEALPVGAALPPSATISAATALLFALGPDPVPAALALPAGLVLGLVYRRLELKARESRNSLGRQAENAAMIRWALLKGLCGQFLVTAAFLAAALLLFRPLLNLAWVSFPEIARRGLETALRLAPWLGAAAVVKALWVR